MNCRQDNNIAEDALTALDICLVFLMGALDAAARVAHRVLGLPPGPGPSGGMAERTLAPGRREDGAVTCGAGRRRDRGGRHHDHRQSAAQYRA